LLPLLLGQAEPEERTLFWRYKSQSQRAVRSGPWKYLRINDNEFLFDVVQDPRERANLRELQPEVFAELRQQWEEWELQLLPLTAEVYSHGLSPDIQADRYVPERLTQG
ncbi:MAG: twin-arginine translocation pathway signal protein, partial [Comamonas sp.]|nr:twin-arginine translocation pathway signal protein [Comamonas sp.]